MIYKYYLSTDRMTTLWPLNDINFNALYNPSYNYRNLIKYVYIVFANTYMFAGMMLCVELCGHKYNGSFEKITSICSFIIYIVSSIITSVISVKLLVL